MATPSQATPATPEVPNLDNFDAAFEKLAEMVDSPPDRIDLKAITPETPAETPPPAAAEEPEKDKTPPVEEPEDEDDEAEEIETPEEDDEDTEDVEEVEAKKSSADEELLERFAKIVKEKAAPSEAPAQAQQAPQTPQQSVFSPEESEFLTTYEKEWPDIAKAESLRRRAEYQQLVGYVFSEIAKEFSPILESVKTISERTHLQDLQAKVGDYDDVRDKVIDWVAQQPAYLQPAYNHVIQQGTVDEVEDLINRYKADTGVKVASAPAPVRKKVETELPSATKQAAASLAPVSSKRSAVVTGIDSGDFDSAFSAFADKL